MSSQHRNIIISHVRFSVRLKHKISTFFMLHLLAQGEHDPIKETFAFLYNKYTLFPIFTLFFSNWSANSL